MGFHGRQWTDAMRARRNAKLGSVADRILSRIEYDTNGGCWLWTAGITKDSGYGAIQVNGQSYGAHRLSWLTFRGEISDGLCVCHRCDIRVCVNPAHLFIGTHADNVHDMYRKGRDNTPRGSAHVRAKLTESDIPDIMRRLAVGETPREIGESYGLSDCAVNAIRRGKSWRHVSGLPASRGIIWSEPKSTGEGAGASNGARPADRMERA